MPRGAGYRPFFFVGVYMPRGAGYCPCDFAAILRGCRVFFFGRLFFNLARAIQTTVHSRSSAAQ